MPSGGGSGSDDYDYGGGDNDSFMVMAGGNGATCHFARQWGKHCRRIQRDVVKAFDDIGITLDTRNWPRDLCY